MEMIRSKKKTLKGPRVPKGLSRVMPSPDVASAHSAGARYDYNVSSSSSTYSVSQSASTPDRSRCLLTGTPPTWLSWCFPAVLLQGIAPESPKR